MTPARHVLRISVAILAFAASIAAPSAAVAATRVIHWSPFSGDGSLRSGLSATPRFGGDCWTGSFVLHHGYRCMSGNRIYDPCFSDPNRDDVVVCVENPFVRGVVRLRVSGALDDVYSARPGSVWAVRLASGTRCAFLAGGATNADGAGRRLNYYCRRSNLVLWGSPRRQGSTWRIRASHGNNPGLEHLVAISAAYIGVG